MNRPGTPAEKLNVLAYSILKLADWDIQHRGLNRVGGFNIDNNFSLTKVLLLPFYMSTANGPDTREELFSFFNNFFAKTEGYIEGDIQANIADLPGLAFVPGKTMIEIQPDYITNEGMVNLQQFRADHVIEAIPKIENVKGENFPINDVYDLIDHSVSVYQNNGWFITEFEDDTLKELCYKHSTWQVYRMLSGLQNMPIQSKMLIQERSVFSKNIENRMLA